MSKKVDVWMPLLVDKYLGDTTHLTTEQHGAYLLLLMSMWKKDGRLPNNDQQLAQMAGLSPAKWRATRPVLIDGVLLRVEDGFVVQKRLAAELARSKANAELKSEAGAKGAAKRWQKDASAMPVPLADALADASLCHRQTGSSISIPIPTPPNPERAATSASVAREPDDDENPDPPDLTGHAPTPAGLVCLAMRQAGLQGTNPGDPRLLALLEQGATEAEFSGLAAEAVGKGKGWGWVLAVLQARRADAAVISLAPKPSATVPAPVNPADEWLAEQAERAREVEAQRIARMARKAAGVAS